MAVSILVQYDFDPTPYPSPSGYAFGTLRVRPWRAQSAYASRLRRETRLQRWTHRKRGGENTSPSLLSGEGVGG
jgi:hypothetical protein